MSTPSPEPDLVHPLNGDRAGGSGYEVRITDDRVMIDTHCCDDYFDVAAEEWLLEHLLARRAARGGPA